MSWHDVDAPDQVAAETGPNLATGDYTATNPDWTLADGVWSREGGGLLLLATDQWGEMAFTPDAHYEVRADVHGATAYKSLVNVDGGGDQATLPVEAPLPETLPGDGWVQVTQAGRAPTDPATGSFAIEATGPGLVQVRNPPVAVRTGRIILTVPGDVLAENIMASGGIVAGTPGGARVELNEEGLLAFDATNTETARINGEGGEFVGGEFRTSDNLPGQIRLADDAYVTHFDGGGVFPGMRITPADASGFSHLPAIGPSAQGLTIYGGRGTGGGSSIVQCNPTESLMRTFRDDYSVGGVIQTSPTASLMRTYREDGGIGGSIQASPAKAFMQTYGDPAVGRAYSQVDPQKATMNVVGANGSNTARITADEKTVTLFSSANGQRYLKLNATGIWIETGGKSYNLEETAQDSGWIALSYASGFASAGSGGPFQIRRMGGMVHLRGRLARTSGTIVAGTEYTIGTLSSSWRPAYTQRTLIAGGSSSQWGRIEVSAITGEISVAAISGNMNWVDLTGTLWTVD